MCMSILYESFEVIFGIAGAVFPLFLPSGVCFYRRQDQAGTMEMLGIETWTLFKQSTQSASEALPLHPFNQVLFDFCQSVILSFT